MKSVDKIKVIIADDHKFFRTGLEAVLKSLSYVETVVQAENGRHLIDLMEKESFHVAFVDISMPELTGIDAVKIISERHPLVKVIALSMHDDRENILQMLNNGAKGYILKNTDKDEIEEAIQMVLSGKQYFSNQVSVVLYHELASKGNKSKPEHELLLKDRHIEIIFLLCYELKNAHIADVLPLVTSTIESYRKEAIHILGCKTTAGLIKYGIESGLYKDPILLEKFKDAIVKRKEEE